MFTIAMLLLAADPLVTTRKELNNCMIEFANAKLKEGVESSAFGEAAKTTCTTQRDAMKAAISKSERSFGSSQKEADEYAAEEVQSVMDIYTGNFQDYKDSKSSFVPMD